MKESESSPQIVTANDKAVIKEKHISPSQKKLDEVNAYFARIDTDQLLQTLWEGRDKAKTNDK